MERRMREGWSKNKEKKQEEEERKGEEIIKAKALRMCC